MRDGFFTSEDVELVARKLGVDVDVSAAADIEFTGEVLPKPSVGCATAAVVTQGQQLVSQVSIVIA